MRKEQELINDKILKLEFELKQLPEGEILCEQNGKYVKWYKSNGTKPIYIKKSDRQFAEKLALKKYLRYQLEELQARSVVLHNYSIEIDKKRDKSQLLLTPDSPYAELLKSYFNSFTNEVLEWVENDYIRNTNYSENLIHKTLAGHMVRSKSEAMIANSLWINKIPYRYEGLLTLDDINIFPDFTILHPRTKKLIYWEHFGMMENTSYCDNAFKKMKIYSDHEIIPTINLITTYETQKKPLDSGRIQQIIETYFL